ncbi:beta glucosidase 33 [Striga asiatica]|uniref:Beta glucosidase 33 n=1 Tax=Striga asiatica TaxID=4170 RepID=A0A5A7PY76_STRAF|nr:beta glucosidase 33 [Striga asiatica]
MNNTTTSDYSCESESGWTTYWAQLSNSIDSNYNEKISAHNIVNEYIDVDDDNLSMLSDASSGPRPNINEDHFSSFSGGGVGDERGSNRIWAQREAIWNLDITWYAEY